MLKPVQHDGLWARCQILKSEIGREINPLRVIAFNQVDLPLAMPALQLLFAQDGAFHVPEQFVADEAMGAILARESGNGVGSVLMESRDKIGCDADVQHIARLAGQDIDARPSIHNDLKYEEKRTLKQVQGDGLDMQDDEVKNADA